MCPGWCWACSMQNAFCTPNGFARRGGSHPYVKDDRSTVQMVLCTFSGPLPRRTEDRIYWHRPNPQGRQSLHVDHASTGTAINSRYLGQATRVDKINDIGTKLSVSKGQPPKVVKMDDLRPMGPIYV